MKRLLSSFVLLALIAAPAAMAQDDEPPRYISIFTAHTMLGHQQQYEAGIKKLWAAMKKAGGDFPVLASQSVSNPGDYNFVTLLSSMADMDSNNEMFGKIGAQSPDVFEELGKHSNGNSSRIIEPRPDLSYRPATPRLGDDEGTYARATFYYTHPAHAQDFEGLLKKFAELSKKKGMMDGYTVYTNAVGDGPVYVVRVLAKSEADYYAQAEKNSQKMGEDGAALRTKAGPMLDRIESSASVRRPDLGYQP